VAYIKSPLETTSAHLLPFLLPHAMSARNSSTPPKAVERVYVGRGLDGLDDNIDVLESYFREMQKTSVETAYGPEDFLSFVGCAHYFGVIMIETQVPAVPSESNPDDGTDEDAEGEPEEETLPVSRATVSYPLLP